MVSIGFAPTFDVTDKDSPWLFTQLLVLNEPRGPHATDVAWLNRDGEHRLFKHPVWTSRFVSGCWPE